MHSVAKEFANNRTCRAVIDGITDALKRERFIDALEPYFLGSVEGFLFSSIGALNHAYEDGVELPAPTRFAPIGQGG